MRLLSVVALSQLLQLDINLFLGVDTNSVFRVLCIVRQLSQLLK